MCGVSLWLVAVFHARNFEFVGPILDDSLRYVLELAHLRFTAFCDTLDETLDWPMLLSQLF
jgi:hypothetical protein